MSECISIIGNGVSAVPFYGSWYGSIDYLFPNQFYTITVSGDMCFDLNCTNIIENWFEVFYYGTAPDMGAYEVGESFEIMAGDTNFDGIVDILDIVQIVNF